MRSQVRNRKKTYLLLAALAILAALFLSRATQAQVLYGSLTGSVTDPSGAVVVGASVEALNVGTGAASKNLTNSRGSYNFTLLQPGTYKVTVATTGFSPHVTDNIVINANSMKRNDVQLKLGVVAQEVSILSGVLLLQTDRTDVSTQLDSKEIMELPTTSSAGRSYQALYKIIPGFSLPTERNSGGGNPQRSMSSNVNGLSSQGNNTRIDGASNSYLWLPANLAYIPPADSIESVNVVTNSYEAEQGTLGAAINVQIKSGINDFHGEVYEFHTDNALRARNYFQPVGYHKPKDISNQYGGQLSGPVIKNRLFFFSDWESTKRRQFGSQSATVPNPDAMFDSVGNVSFASVIEGGSDCTVPRAGCIYDPNTGNANGSGRTPFPNNTIPANRIDPAVKIMLSRIDKKNFLNNFGMTAANNYYAANPTGFNRDNWDEKLNFAPSGRSTFFARYSLSQSNISDPPMLGDAIGDSTNHGQTGNSTSRIQSIGLGATYTLSNRMLFDMNLGFMRQRLGAQSPDLALGAFGRDVLKIPGANGAGDIMQGGIPSFQTGTNSYWANMGNANTGSPFLFRDNNWSLNSNMSWIYGAHDLRLGIEVTRSQMNHFQPQGGSFQTARGTFSFAGDITALNGGEAANQYNALAQLLLGFPSRVGIAVQFINPNAIRWSTWSWYIRDRFQLTPKLTLSYGVRWEFYPFASADHGGLRVFDPETGNVLIGGHGNVPNNAGVDAGSGQFLPRLGIAYRLSSKTVIRAGYGMAADNNNWRFMRSSYPLTTILDVQPAGFAPAASLTGETLAPYPGLKAGIPTAAFPAISSGSIPLPDSTGTTTVAKDFRRGYFHSYNLTVQREVSRVVIEAAFIGTRGIRALTNYNLNSSYLGGGDAGRLLNVRFPGRNFGDINILQPSQNTYYDALQMKITRKFGRGSTAGIVYTFSKTIDSEDDEELNSLMWPYPAYMSRNHALAGFDRTHNFAFYGLVQLPFGKYQHWAQKGIANAIAGGWQINWVLNSVSGTPFSIIGGGNTNVAPGNTQTADQVRPVRVLGNIGPMSGQPSCALTNMSCHWFDPSVFNAVPSTENRFGNTGRNILRGPGYFNLDASLFRDFKISERTKFQFRMEVFSLTNTPHFANPGNTVTNTNTFGVITSTFQLSGQMAGSGGERWYWFAGKLMF
jgi:hypothetical protein